MSRIRVIKAQRAGRPVAVARKPRPCGCRDVAAIARESARIAAGKRPEKVA